MRWAEHVARMSEKQMCKGFWLEELKERFDLEKLFANTGLFEMIVGVLTIVIHNTLEIGVYVFFYLIEQHSKFLLLTLQVLYM